VVSAEFDVELLGDFVLGIADLFVVDGWNLNIIGELVHVIGVKLG
jgi:hypothetical protein